MNNIRAIVAASVSAASLGEGALNEYLAAAYQAHDALAAGVVDADSVMAADQLEIAAGRLNSELERRRNGIAASAGKASLMSRGAARSVRRPEAAPRVGGGRRAGRERRWRVRTPGRVAVDRPNAAGRADGRVPADHGSRQPADLAARSSSGPAGTTPTPKSAGSVRTPGEHREDRRRLQPAGRRGLGWRLPAGERRLQRADVGRCDTPAPRRPAWLPSRPRRSPVRDPARHRRAVAPGDTSVGPRLGDLGLDRGDRCQPGRGDEAGLRRRLRLRAAGLRQRHPDSVAVRQHAGRFAPEQVAANTEVAIAVAAREAEFELLTLMYNDVQAGQPEPVPRRHPRHPGLGRPARRASTGTATASRRASASRPSSRVGEGA